jgi:hypothetical protein
VHEIQRTRWRAEHAGPGVDRFVPSSAWPGSHLMARLMGSFLPAGSRFLTRGPTWTLAASG